MSNTKSDLQGFDQSELEESKVKTTTVHVLEPREGSRERVSNELMPSFSDTIELNNLSSEYYNNCFEGICFLYIFVTSNNFILEVFKLLFLQ